MKVVIVGDRDSDGMIGTMLGKKLVMYEFEEENPRIDIRIIKTPREHDFQRIARENYDLVVLVDNGAERGQAINKIFKNTRVWIIDHHRRFDREYPEVEMYINPTEEGKDSLEYAVASTLVAKELHKRKILSRYNAYLAATAAAGDIADFTTKGKFKGLNWWAMKFASKRENISLEYDLTLRYKWVGTLNIVAYNNYYPAPNEERLKMLWNELDHTWNYSSDEEKIKMLSALMDVYEDDFNWAYRKTLINYGMPAEVAEIHEFAAFIETIGTLDAIKHPEKYLEEAYIGTVSKMKTKYNIPKPLDVGNAYLLVTRKFIRNVEITMAATRHYTDKPVIAVSQNNGHWYITARQHPKVNVDLGKMLYETTKGIGYGGGHRFAAGGGIYKEDDVPEFVRRIREYEF